MASSYQNRPLSLTVVSLKEHPLADSSKPSLSALSYLLGIIAYSLVILKSNLLVGCVVGVILFVIYLRPGSRHSRKVRGHWRRFVGAFAKSTPRSSALSHGRLTWALNYNVGHERVPILLAGLALNAVGLTLAITFPTVLYLDMVGTALAAFLLGPWYGAIVACLSSSIVHPLLFPLDTLPWMPLNIIGALYWGWIAKFRWFRELGNEDGPTLSASLVMLGGVAVATGLAFVGLVVFWQVGGQSTSLAIDGRVSAKLAASIITGSNWIKTNIPMLSQELGLNPDDLSTLIVNFCRFIPDKVLTVAVAILFIRICFPVNWSLLVRGRPTPAEAFFLPRQPFMFGLLVVAVTISHHLFTLAGNGKNHSRIYTFGYVFLCGLPFVCGLAAQFSESVTNEEIQAEWKRSRTYIRLRRHTKRVRSRFDKQGVLLVLMLVIAIQLVFQVAGGGYKQHNSDGIPVASRGLLGMVLLFIMILQLAEISGEQQVGLEVLKDERRLQSSVGAQSTEDDLQDAIEKGSRGPGPQGSESDTEARQTPKNVR